MTLLERIAHGIGCPHPDQTTTDHNGDPCCDDCAADWASIDDNAEWHTHTYH